MKSRINVEKIKNNIIIGWIKFKNLVKEHKYISSVLGLFLISCIIGLAVYAQEDEYAGKIAAEINEIETYTINESGVLGKSETVYSFDTIVFGVKYYLNGALPSGATLSRDAIIEATVDTEDVDVYWYHMDQDDGNYEIGSNKVKVEMYDKAVGTNNSSLNEIKLYLKVNNVENDKEISVTIKVYESTSEEKSNSKRKSFKVSSTLQPLTAKIRNGSAYKKDEFKGRYVPYGILLGFEGDSLKGKYFSKTEIILEASQELNGQIQQLSLDTTDDYYGVYDKDKKLLSNFPNGKYDDTDSSVKDSGSVLLEKLESETKSSQIQEKKSSPLYLLGDKSIILEVGEEYNDPGVSLSNKGTALGNDKYKTIFKNSENKEISDYNAMVSKEGTYKIGYVYENGPSKTTIYRNVEVIASSGDKSVSVDGNTYSLNGNTNINLIKGEKYEEPGILKNGKRIEDMNSDNGVTIEITKDDNIETAGGKIIYTIISKNNSSTQKLLKRNVNVIEKVGEVGVDEKVLNASTVEQCTGAECKISYYKDNEEIKDISSVQSGTYDVEYKLSNEDYEVVIRSTMTIEKKVQYKLKIDNIKTDDIYYKDNNFIALGAYFVNVMSERPEGNTNDIPVSLKIVKIGSTEADITSVPSINLNVSEGTKTSTLDFYTGDEDSIDLLDNGSYLAYGEETILRSQFSYSKDGDNTIKSLSVKVPVNTGDNQFSMVEYSTDSESPAYDVNYNVKVEYYDKDGKTVKFSDETLAYIIYTAEGVSPGTNIDFRVRLKVNSINHGKSVKLSGATCSADGKNINVDIKQTLNITSFKARTTISVDGNESDIEVDGSKKSTWTIYPTVSRPASVINTQVAGTNQLDYVNITVELPEGINYVYNDEYDKPTITENGRKLTYKILGKKINDWFEPIYFDTNYDINIENGKKLTVKSIIDATTKDETPITDISSEALRTTSRSVIFQNVNNIRFSLTTDYSAVSKNQPFTFSSNVYNSQSENTSTVIILPYNEDIEGSKKFNGTYSLDLSSISSNKEVYCTKENSSNMVTNSDSLASSEIWNTCDDYSGVTAIKIVGSDNTMKNIIKIIPENNKSDDNYEIRAYLYDNGLKKVSDKKTNVSVISKKITGIVWEDFDDNGIMDIDESMVSDVILKLYNAETDEYINQTVSDVKGQYTLSDLEPGKYYISAEFNTAKYGLTQYRASENKSETSSFKTSSSDYITDEIEITNNTRTINNINLGLSLKKVYKLKLSKYVNKVIITDKLGIPSTRDFNNVTLAKVDVKDFANVKMKVVYVLELENIGYYPGYVYRIKDYIPDGMTFNAEYEENTGWELNEDGYLENNTLSDELIYGGQKKYLTIAFDVTRKEAGSFINYAEVNDDDLFILSSETGEDGDDSNE